MRGGILSHNRSMNNLLIVGCGDVALRTIPLLRGHYRLYALVRNPAYCSRLRGLGVKPILGDLDDRNSLSRIAGLANVVLHFAPPITDQRTLSSPPDGTTSHHTKQPEDGCQVVGYKPASGQVAGYLPPGEARPALSLSKEGGWGNLVTTRSLYDTRTRHLLATLSRGTPPKQLIYISTSGVYGDCGGDVVSETRSVNPQNSRTQLRVSAEKQIRTWAKHHQVNASILRVPGIYCAERLPLERLRAGSPVIVAEQDSYSNHIHADDLARIVVAALRRARPNRVYHAVDDDEMKMGDYFDVIADAFDLPRPPRLSRANVQRAVSPVMWSFMNESRRLTNARMKRELKVELRYPTAGSALAAVRSSKSSGRNNSGQT